MNSNQIEEFIIKKIANELKINPNSIDTDRPFSEIGLDSVSAIGMTGDLEEFLKIKIKPTIVFEYSTIEKLSTYLAREVNQGVK